jgi:hypothetical protein
MDDFNERLPETSTTAGKAAEETAVDQLDLHL